MSDQHPDSSSGPVPGQPYGPGPQPPTPGPTPAYGPTFPPAAGQPTAPGAVPAPYPPQYGPLGPPPWRDPLPAAGTEYHRFLRTERNRWWKGAVAILGFVLGYLIINTALGIVAIGFDIATGRSTWEALSSGTVTFTPAVFLATNVSNALSIPLAMLLQWAIWGQPRRWLHSVAGAFRWRLVGRCAAVVIPIWLVYMGISAVAFPAAMGTSGPGDFTTESVVLLVIMLLTTPLQAAGEEYGARGLIMRAAGSYAASPLLGIILATLIPSVIFMFAHGAGDPWLNVYYFFFGAVMSILVWRLGGLEAPVVLHAVNNMVAFGVVILAGQEINLDRSAGTGGAFMLVPMAVLALVTVVLVLLGKRWQLQRTYAPGGAVPAGQTPAAVTPGTEGNRTH